MENSTRQIKFRAWDKKQNKMFYFDLLDIKDDGIVLDTKNPDDILTTYLEDNMIMQSTRLKDEKDKEIYEGDIMKYLNEDTHEVIFHGGCFVYKISEKEYHIFNQKEVEVIGNIYENPELLT